MYSFHHQVFKQIYKFLIIYTIKLSNFLVTIKFFLYCYIIKLFVAIKFLKLKIVIKTFIYKILSYYTIRFFTSY